MSVLVVDGISLSFGGLTVLNNVSLELRKGELLALVGPNGAGKTSIFNCISGLYRPSGNIYFLGQSLVGKKPHRVAASGVARTFQHGELPEHQTVMEAVLSGRHTAYRSSAFAEFLSLPSYRSEEKEHRAKVRILLKLLEMERLAALDVGSLPFGIQKMVGVARALASEPKLLLLDEPSAGLTREERETMARFILKAKLLLGIPIMWIEHDMQMVADLADRVHVLDYGRSLADGPPGEVLNDPNVVAAYLGN